MSNATPELPSRRALRQDELIHFSRSLCASPSSKNLRRPPPRVYWHVKTMAVANWHFIDHRTSHDAATRKLVRATVARNHRRNERMRTVHTYSQRHAAKDAPTKPQNDNENEEGGLIGCVDESVGPTEEFGHSCSHREVVPSLDSDKDEIVQDVHALMRYSAKSPWGNPSISGYFDPSAAGSPALAYQSEHGRLLYHCEPDPAGFPSISRPLIVT